MIAGLVALIVLLGALLLLSRGGGGKGVARLATVKASTSTSSAAQKAAAAQAAQAAIVAQQNDKAFVASLETVLSQSSSGRVGVGTVVGQVQNGCAITPENASLQIRQVIDNRTSVLNQLAGMQLPAGSVDAANLRTLLQTALQDSIQADTYYKEWMDGLQADYGAYGNYYWCPGAPPTDAYGAYAQARATDTQSSAAKQAFVNAFNPVAQQFGLQAWDPGQV